MSHRLRFGASRRHMSKEPLVAAVVHHLEVYVRDLETSAVFWSWLLFDLGATLVREWDEGTAFALGGTEVVLVQAPADASDLDRRDVGVNHLAFRVAQRGEVDRITERARERGVRVLYPDRHPHAGGPDHYALFCEDPDGLKVEVVAAESLDTPLGADATDADER